MKKYEKPLTIYRECMYAFDIPHVGRCCHLPNGIYWGNYPLCKEENCPLIHPELLENSIINGTATRFCPHCGKPVIKSDLPQYVWQCLECDEDFYDIECPVLHVEAGGKYEAR